MRVLLVDDDRAASRGLVLLLEEAGIITDGVDTGAEALDLARRNHYDLILLDLMLPDVDGCEVIRRMRLARIDVPVLVLSGLSRAEVRVQALGMGADDFMVKPFDRGELIARAQAVVRRSKAVGQTVVRVGSVGLNLDTREVTVAGTPVRLTGKEFAVLELLILRRGTTLSKETLLSHLYGGMDEPEGKIIDVFVCKLRRKLALAGAPDFVGTVWGLGYTVRDPRHADVIETSLAAEVRRPIMYDA
jgi:two-component system, cell cycle response regulator CtrA